MNTALGYDSVKFPLNLFLQFNLLQKYTEIFFIKEPNVALTETLNS